VDSKEEIVIPLSKLKISLLVVGSALFVACGVYFLGLDPESIRTSDKINNPSVVYGISYACIAFCGLTCVYGFVKIFDSKPGLIINKEGITDNSSGVSAGLIPWNEITGFSEFEIHSTKMLIIMVKEPEKYANRGSVFKRALNKANMNLVGSPISISSTALKMKYSDLHEILLNRHAVHSQSA
jgi:hypothetical protein